MAVPNHVAVIMDGNGRWAKERHLPRVEGHRRGIEALRKTIRAARKSGVRHLSVFAFSSENWARPRDEVDALMRYFVMGLKKEAKPLAEAGVRLHVVGQTEAFSEELQEAIREAESVTGGCDGMTLNVLANYGGRWDIVRAVNRLVKSSEAVTEESLGRELSMPWAGPVDLMIRTGGEVRISNFILWQSAYAELYFTDRFWPDFGEEDFENALSWFASRQRRFGMTGEQVTELEKISNG